MLRTTQNSLVSAQEQGGSLLGAGGITPTDFKEQADLPSSRFVPESQRE